jgi:hypothetical protein
LCIWLRKYDFLTGKVRYWSDPDPKLFIPDPDPDPDPAKSSGSDRIRIRIRIHNTGSIPESSTEWNLRGSE